VYNKENGRLIPIRSDMGMSEDVCIYIYICGIERWSGERAGAESRSRRNASSKQENCG